MTYAQFFAVATGHAPYEYQRRMAEAAWPDALVAPTGLGKTAAVVLAWLWHRRQRPETPRRLVYCLPMRTLVEQTGRLALEWLCRLHAAGLGDGLPAADDLHVLMGGHAEPKWYERPERPAILIGTQDMLLSRALMRGYAMNRFRWPVDFALLHNDAQWVFDEVQLMGAGLATSAQLQGFRDGLGATLPARSLWLSATLDPEWLRTVDFAGPRKVLRVPDDVPLDCDDLRVRKLLDAAKPLEPSPVVPADDKAGSVASYVQALAALIDERHRPGRTTLAIVNTVQRAQQLHAAVRKAGTGAMPAVLVHSRFRPADRARQMAGLLGGGDRVAVATQAVEAGIDFSAGLLITELAPWASLVQRFGRANRNGEMTGEGGAPIVWIDLPDELAAPYSVEALADARRRLAELADAAPARLAPASRPGRRPRVIRRKDLLDLFDTDPDLTGFDVDVSAFVRDAGDTDLHLFWRNLGEAGPDDEPPPRAEELCAAPIGRTKAWLRDPRNRQRLRAYRLDPQVRRGHAWQRLEGEPWPGLVLLLDAGAGGYCPETGFDPTSTEPVETITFPAAAEKVPKGDDQDGDPNSEMNRFVGLERHLRDVADAAAALCGVLHLPPELTEAVVRAGRWHDLGKAHEAFQARMAGTQEEPRPEGLLAKAVRYDRTAGRRYFRHELASALAYLAAQEWSRRADFVAYLVAAHHGKVRLSLRALPAERAPDDGRPFARGVWQDDVLPPVDLGNGETWAGGGLSLSVMELGEHPASGASWTERTRALLAAIGPFRLAFAEALVRIADWRASADERRAEAGDG